MSDPDKAADARFDEWEALCEAATPGPWQVERPGWITAGEGGYDDVLYPGEVRCGSYCYGGTSTVDLSDPDAAFIAAFDPDTVLTLIQALRAIHDAHYEQQTGPDEFRCAECGHHYPCPTKTQLVYPAIGVSDE